MHQVTARERYLVVSGTREQLTPFEEEIVETTLLPYVEQGFNLYHGACPTGVDAAVVKLFGGRLDANGESIVFGFPPRWNDYGRAAGPMRNDSMLTRAKRNDPEALLIAFPKGRSPGTRGCIALAKKREMRVEVVEL